MGAEVVVGILPVPEGGVHGGGRGLGAGDCMEFPPVGASGALHVRVELGGSGWKHEEADAAVAAGRFALGFELRTAIDLDGFDGKGDACADGVQEGGGGTGGTGGGGPRTCMTSQRETVSGAVKCFRSAPGRGRGSRVSTWTRSPESSMR